MSNALSTADELEALEGAIAAKRFGELSLTELLFYGLAEPGGEGAASILRAARDDLRNLADLTMSARGGSEHVSLEFLGASLDGIARRLDVVIELGERTERDKGGSRGEVAP